MVLKQAELLHQLIGRYINKSAILLINGCRLIWLDFGYSVRNMSIVLRNNMSDHAILLGNQHQKKCEFPRNQTLIYLELSCRFLNLLL